MRNILIFISLVLFLVSCGYDDSYKLNKENVEKTYKRVDRSLNLEDKKIKWYISLNKYMSWTEISNIFIWNNEIELINVSWFEKLWTLDIKNNNISFIWDLKLPNNITSLNLSWNDLSDIKWIEKYTKLKKIDLSYNKLTDEDFESLKALKNLIYINVKWNDVSEELLNQISNFNATFLYNNDAPFTNDLVE